MFPEDRAANIAARKIPGSDQRRDHALLRIKAFSESRPGQRGKYRFRCMGDYREQCPRRSARHALALLPVANGFNRHP